MTVLRYIHQNPVKAGLCKYAEDYAYSSVRKCLKYPVLVDTDFAFSIIPKDQLIDYHRQENEDRCLEMDGSFRLTDEDAKKLIIKIAKRKNISEFQLLDSAKKKHILVSAPQKRFVH